MVPKNNNMVGKSAGESLSNKFVSIIFCTTKGATRLYTDPYGHRSK